MQDGIKREARGDRGREPGDREDKNMPDRPIETKTVIYRVRVNFTATPLGRGKCVSVIVRNVLTNSDGTANTAIIAVGDGATQMYDLLPGVQTIELFTSDLKDIYVRLIPGVGAVPVDACVIVHRDAAPVRVKGSGV